MQLKSGVFKAGKITRQGLETQFTRQGMEDKTHAWNGEVQNEEVRKVRDYLEQTSLGHCIVKHWASHQMCQECGELVPGTGWAIS